MEAGDTLIPKSNPTFVPLPGEIQHRHYAAGRPVARPHRRPELLATTAQFRSGNGLAHQDDVHGPVGPMPGGGFAIGIVAKTGGKDDLATETRIAVTVNVRPGFLVRLNVPFGVDRARRTWSFRLQSRMRYSRRPTRNPSRSS